MGPVFRKPYTRMSGILVPYFSHGTVYYSPVNMAESSMDMAYAHGAAHVRSIWGTLSTDDKLAQIMQGITNVQSH